MAGVVQETVDGSWSEALAAVEWYPFESLRQLGIGAGWRQQILESNAIDVAVAVSGNADPG